MKGITLLGLAVLGLGLVPGPVFGATEGTYNSCFGLFAGHNTTDSIRWNTLIGVSAGYSNTGWSNTFLGSHAGYSNTIGGHNIFIGPSSGYYNATGSNNIFLGVGAGFNNTGSERNIFIGSFAGTNDTTGKYNTFLGDFAGYSNTMGSDNVFIGRSAGYSNNGGHENTFIGNWSGTTNTDGHNNTFLGHSAGLKNTTGWYNTFLGFSAGSENTTGYKNTFLGMYAGRYNLTGAKNVFLGYMAGYNETGSNKLYIANTETATPLIYGEFGNQKLVVNGKLGVGRAPTYPLHMASGAYVSTGGVWTNASSRQYKDQIRSLSAAEALAALNELNPVKYVYKADRGEKHVGFIAEEVPELLATKDRKGLSAMDIVAVLTKALQEQQKFVLEQQKLNQELLGKISELENKLKQVTAPEVYQ